MASSVTKNVAKKQCGLQVFRIFYLRKRFLFDYSSCHGRTAYLSIDESPEAEQHLWHVRQIFLDENADGDFRIEADVNPDATQGEGEVIFKNYRVGFVEDLAE